MNVDPTSLELNRTRESDSHRRTSNKNETPLCGLAIARNFVKGAFSLCFFASVAWIIADRTPSAVRFPSLVSSSYLLAVLSPASAIFCWT